MDKELAEIIGMCIGDGCISITNKYHEFALSGDMTEERTYYDTHVMPLLNKKLFAPIIGRKLKAKKYEKIGVYGIITFDKRVVEKLLQLGLAPSPKTACGIPDAIKNGNSGIKRSFLRGLFDTDGSIAFEKNYTIKEPKHNRPKILIASTSKRLMEETSQICNDLGFFTMNRKPWKGKRDKNTMYGLVIKRKKDVDRWLKEVGFSSQKHITKIALWKRTGICPPYTRIEQRLHMLKMVSPSAKLKSLKC